MPKMRRKATTTKKGCGVENLMKSCRVTVTRMSLKDIAAELSGKKCNVDCQLGEDEINRFLASQKAILSNEVPIYKRKVNLIERTSSKNDVYQFNYDAATELQLPKCKKTRKNTRGTQKAGIRKRKPTKANKNDVLNEEPAVAFKPKVVTQISNIGSVRNTRARSIQLMDIQDSIGQPKPPTKIPTPLKERKVAENVKENVPNVSDEFVELKIIDSNITDRRLDKTKQFGQSTSTPLMQRKSGPKLNTTNDPEKSPWRIQEGIRCPKTFYFSYSNDLMPSYASDVIPNETIKKTSMFQKSSVQGPPPTAENNIDESSFDVNNSNAENISPFIGPNKRVSVLSNILLKPAANRSPLRQMEIIGLQEEAEEPENTSRISTLATHSLTASKVKRIRKFATNMIENQPNLQHEKPSAIGFQSTFQSSDETTAQRNESDSIEDAFGFYTIDNFDDETISTDDEQHNHSKSALKQRLKSLKKLVPRKSTKTTRLPCQSPMSKLFHSPRRGAKPTNIREMFEKQLLPDKCSTPQRPAQDENASLTLDEIELTANDAASIRLFNDPLVPEVPKIDHPLRRSYSRIVTRKRKRVVGFIAVSDNESDSDTDAEPVRTKKLVRTKKKVNVEETSEFKAFVVAMNKEFAEVDKYELVIN